MIREPHAMFCYADLGGQIRGKGFPAAQIDERLAGGLGWTPTNIMFTALGTIAPSPWSSFGDVMMMADPATRTEVDFEDGSPAERFYLCDILETDGGAWDCCPRTFLKDSVAELARAAGVIVRATFEHEFLYSGARSRPADMYALDAVRRHGAFGETYLAALAAADIPVDTYLSEFGQGQFEVTMPPAEALAACDRAIILRELARATAQRLGETVTFSPRPAPEGLGSGLHIHFSLWDADGRPLSHDPDGPHGVSDVAGRFLAGILAHMPALCAFTVPSPVSYLRLVPHAWTGIWSNLGVRDREAGIRICPTFGSPDKTARQFNFEFRAADATANPYLQLAMLLRAGLEGLRSGLDCPEPTVGIDPGNMTEAARAERGIVRLPGTLADAFEALDADATLASMLPERLLAAYCANKRAEMALADGWDAETVCARYAEIY